MIGLKEYISIYESKQEDLIKQFKRDYKNHYSKVYHTIKSESDILIISQCGATKNIISKDKKIHAKDMYIGPANKLLRDNLDGLNVDWVILSGAYGLINSETKINYYDDVFMDISPKTYIDLKDFTKYNEDLISIIKNHKYKKIIFTVGIRFLYSFNFQEISNYIDDDCEVIISLPDQLEDDDDFIIPKNITTYKITDDIYKRFHCAEIFAKERIAIEYVKYIRKNKDIGFKNFLRNFSGKSLEK